MNTNVKCLLSLVFGAGLGYYAARTILERNYTVSVSNAFHDARGYNGPGYKKRVTVTVKGEMVSTVDYPALTDSETGEPYSEAVQEKTAEYMEKAAERRAVDTMDQITNPVAKQALRNYQGLDLNQDAREHHVREEFMVELQQKIEGIPEDEEEDGYGESPLSGGGSTAVYREPYRISEADYGEGVDGYNSLMVVYHEGDRVLSDHLGNRLGPVAAHETVGDFDKLQFGVESSDGNICYMRCDRLKSDFEVIRSEGNFSDVPPSGGNG